MGLKKIAQFLGFSLNEEEIQSIVDKSTFTVMKQKASETHGAFGDIFFRKGTFYCGKEFTCVFCVLVCVHACVCMCVFKICVIECYAPAPNEWSPGLQPPPAPVFWQATNKASVILVRKVLYLNSAPPPLAPLLWLQGRGHGLFFPGTCILHFEGFPVVRAPLRLLLHTESVVSSLWYPHLVSTMNEGKRFWVSNSQATWYYFQCVCLCFLTWLWISYIMSSVTSLLGTFPKYSRSETAVCGKRTFSFPLCDVFLNWNGCSGASCPTGGCMCCPSVHVQPFQWYKYPRDLSERDNSTNAAVPSELLKKLQPFPSGEPEADFWWNDFLKVRLRNPNMTHWKY